MVILIMVLALKMKIIKILKNNQYMIALFPFSLFNLDVIPETVSNFEKFLISILIISLLTLWSFIDIVGHFIVLYLIDQNKYIEKYPKLKPLINYFKKVNYVFFTFEIIFFISIYLMLIGICISLLIFN